MIYDHIQWARAYHVMGPRFALGLDFLQRFDANTLEGRISLDGDNVYALVQDYTPTAAAGRIFETHRLYADIQYLAVGEEIIFCSPLERLQETVPYSAANECTLYSGPDEVALPMAPGWFAILLPQDAHKPCCLGKAAGPVKKVVVKIRL